MEVLVVTIGIAHTGVAHPKMLFSQVAQTGVINSVRIKIGNELPNGFGIRTITVLLKIPASNPPATALRMSLSERRPFNDGRMVTQSYDDLPHLAQRFSHEGFPPRIGVGEHIYGTVLVEWELENFQNSEPVT